MVIEDRNIIYAKNGNLHIHSLKSDETTYIPFDEWTDLGELKQPAYRVGVNDKIRVYALNSVYASYYDLSGNGVELDQMVILDGFSTENISGLYVTSTRATTVAWFREPGQYTHITYGRCLPFSVCQNRLKKRTCAIWHMSIAGLRHGMM